MSSSTAVEFDATGKQNKKRCTWAHMPEKVCGRTSLQKGSTVRPFDWPTYLPTFGLAQNPKVYRYLSDQIDCHRILAIVHTFFVYWDPAVRNLPVPFFGHTGHRLYCVLASTLQPDFATFRPHIVDYLLFVSSSTTAVTHWSRRQPRLIVYSCVYCSRMLCIIILLSC